VTVAEVIGDEIIVTLPLTSYTVTTTNRQGLKLLAKRIASRDDRKCSHLRHQERAPVKADAPKKEAPHWVVRGKVSVFKGGLRAKGQVAECRPLG